ncbi:arginase family protein [Rossellomorea sp. AcN35-11]|nr:arginase family protein [Rossellomorea aquimaris]WJV30850.1 arginase family protein [Rossellomorea sp. AcN35-11]
MNMSKQYVLNPTISVEHKGHFLNIILPYQKKKLQTNLQFSKVVELMKEPNSLEVLEGKGLTGNVLAFLLDESIIIPQEAHSIYRNGLVIQPKNTIGKKLDLNQLENKEFNHRFCFLGIPVSYEHKGNMSPVDGTSLIRSNIKLFDPASSDEEYLVDMNHSRSFKAENVTPYDVGDVSYDSRIETIEDVNKKVRYIVDKMSENHLKPIVLGGDHTVTYPVVSTLMDKYENMTIIHFDAHTDRYESQLRNTKGLTIGNVFSELMKEKHFHQLIQVGIRQFERKYSNDMGISSNVRVYSSNDIHTMEDVTSIFSTVDKNTPIYVSFDVDVLDPSNAPEVAWPVIGGITYHQASLLMEYLSTHFNVVGADFVEVCAGDQKPNLAALSVANLATQLVLNQHNQTYRGEENEHGDEIN